jgi:hypothetical protein
VLCDTQGQRNSVGAGSTQAQHAINYAARQAGTRTCCLGVGAPPVGAADREQRQRSPAPASLAASSLRALAACRGEMGPPQLACMPTRCGWADLIHLNPC